MLEQFVAGKTSFPIGAGNKSPCFRLVLIPGMTGLKTVTAKSVEATR